MFVSWYIQNIYRFSMGIMVSDNILISWIFFFWLEVGEDRYGFENGLIKFQKQMSILLKIVVVLLYNVFYFSVNEIIYSNFQNFRRMLIYKFGVNFM